MKFKHVNIQNVQHLVPAWLADPHHIARAVDAQLDLLFTNQPKLKPKRWDKSLRFWIEMDWQGEGWSFRATSPSGGDDTLACGQMIMTSGNKTVVLPINAFLKGSDPLEDTHCVYIHTLMTECPISYIGITKRPWFERWSEHQSSAQRGSNLVFHSALRAHADLPINHRVIFAGVSQDTAFAQEEEWVSMFSLYPMGLNMIPGGQAGIRYLHKFGIIARNAAERDAQIEEIAEQESVAGKPNPLCAARWLADQDYVNRVVCGHSGRLTVNQVRQIRVMSMMDRTQDQIASDIGAKTSQVRRVATGKAYGRVQ